MRDAAGGEQRLPSNEHCQHLDRLAETHVVGQAAAQAHAFEEREPAQPFPLVVAQRSLKPFRFVLCLGTFAAGQLIANPLERLVDVRLWLTRQERVEECHLDSAIP